LRVLIRDLEYVVTMDAERTVLRKVSIVVEDGVITYVGKAERLSEKGFDRVLDGSGKAAIPGLIDLHGHSLQSFFRGLYDDLPLMPWLRVTSRAYSCMTERAKLLAAKATFLEKLRFGVTTSLDMERDADVVIRAAAEVGVRLVEAVALIDTEEVPFSGLRRVSSPEEELKYAEDLMRKHRKRELIRVIYGPVGFPSSSLELLREAAEAAREKNTLLHCHAAESTVNVELAKKIYGLREIELLEKAGLLGPNLIIAHAVHLSDYELMALAKYGVSVAHCPSSNAKLGNGIARVAEMVWSGVNVGLGCDGAASNNGQDLFTEMKTASLMQKARLGNASVLPAMKVLEMATVNAARALKMQKEIGSIEVGKRGDIVLVNLKSPALMPTANVVSHLVYSVTGRDVDTVLVDGRVLVEGGRFRANFPVEEFYREFEREYDEFLRRLSE